MNDRKLLELAAKGAGYRLSNRLTDGGLMVMSESRPSPHKWNPLTNDGDALRLAVKLQMLIDHESGGVTVVACKSTALADIHIDDLTDPCAATRRAIVRAAAEIGARL